MQMSPITIALLVISIAALGLGVYNFLKIRNVTTAVVAHHNLLDHAEFDKLNPSIKAYYLGMVNQLMPEVVEYANIAWAELPGYAKDASRIQKAADLVKAKRPEFANMIKTVKAMAGTKMIPDTGYPLFVPSYMIPKPAPVPKPTPVPKPVAFAKPAPVSTPAPVSKPVPVPAKTTLKIA